MPAPIWFAFAVLLGWPVIQIISVLVARPRRAQMRQLSQELIQDGKYGPDDKALVERAVRESRGNPAFAVFPVVLPVGILAMSLRELLGRDRATDAWPSGSQLRRDMAPLERLVGLRTGRETVEADPRFHRLRGLVSDLSIIRSPITAMLTLLLCLPVLPVFGIAYGLRQMLTVIPDAASRMATVLRIASSGNVGTGHR